MAISMEQVNALVWQYLRESGFEHTAFIFGSEANVTMGQSFSSQIPNHSLISFLQRALLYMRLERGVKRVKREPGSTEHEHMLKIQEKFAAPEIEDIKPEIVKSCSVDEAASSILDSHRLSVFACKWSPEGSQLATASADGTVVLWTIRGGRPVERVILGVVSDVVTPDHGITSVDWSRDGYHFATGSFDMNVCLYRRNGSVIASLPGHQNQVFSVKFNPSGTHLASSGRSAIIWYVNTGGIVKILERHELILDVDWKDDRTFAAASSDGTVVISSIDTVENYFLQGHTNHVTAVAWSENGEYLASASEDQTVRIWKDCACVMVLTGHNSSVSCVKWVPGHDNLVISSAQNGEVRIWDIRTGCCIHVSQKHTSDVHTLAVSPDGTYVASGGMDQMINVLNVVTGNHVVTFSGDSQLFDLQWDPQGQYLAACFDSAKVAILPMLSYMQ